MSSAPAAEMIEPFFMGSADHQIFACYHMPAEPARDCGVVICYPAWQEYIRSHRACLQLAQRLARAGFPVLRADYLGTGDSAGDSAAVTLDDWRANLRAAISELRDRSGVGSICLVGLRLGASLAAEIAASSREITSLVLWDPAVNGKQYLEETAIEHQEAIMRFLARPKDALKHATEQRPSELLGFAIGAQMFDQIMAINMLAARRSPAADILVVESHTDEPAKELTNVLLGYGARARHQHVECFKLWTESVDKGLVPLPVLNAIVDWLSEVHQ
ncbi:MAG: alpha/beta hydrolase [Roseiflexaceae bacterium]|nr:alpha/beta hydrolase [Roseiflexaceae bacterium]